ncbi:hypothetical protein ACFRCQ_22070 [Cytobacillus firmus]|uniref:hypothetical protein n=1 Tax=Cytobacillus firmus TaxID=1399 RepID=UPI0036B5EB2D
MMPFVKLNADELIQILKQYNHTELHVHHTWKPNHDNFNGKNHEKVQNGMRNFHMKTNGWDDIAQHVSLFPDGTFLTGRNFGKQPVSIKGFNGSGNRIPFACEMVGDFDIGEDKLEGKQRDAILKVAKFFNDQNKYIRFHRENAPWKSCPGTGIDKDEFMEQVRNYGKPAQVYWDGSPMRKGQIGRLTILKPINLWKRNSRDEIKYHRVLQPGEQYRVYGHDQKHGGQYAVGGGYWVSNMEGYVKYETPSKEKMEALKKL